MKKIEQKHAIAALATPPYSSAICIIRLSGKNCIEISKKIFNGFSDTIKPNMMRYGILDAGEIKDEVMVVYFKSPNSYTGEDTVEFYCHGSMAVADAVLKKLFSLGVKQAEAGEFTLRAFLNGKVDLTKSEGIIDLINSETEAEAKGAFSLLSGELYDKIESIQSKIITLSAKIEVAIDYPEEDIEEQTLNETEKALKEIIEDILYLKGSYKTAKIYREGIKVVLFGKPNVGKSKLLNSLLGFDRAIVTSEAGTTRDIIEESYIYKGIRFNISDTAGIREGNSEAENIGIELAKKAQKSADVLLFVTDSGEKPNNYNEKDGKLIIVENKTDINKPVIKESIKVSALKNEGIESLKQEIFNISGAGGALNGAFINNTRQLACAADAETAMERAYNNIRNHTLDEITYDLNEAYRHLGRITGKTSGDEIIDEIFSKFCVGK